LNKFLVTGGAGFIGAALVRRLLRDGFAVRVLDNNSRGAVRRLAGVLDDIEMVTGDIRDPALVQSALKGVDAVHHLAYVNGTGNFYNVPETVLEVAVKGMMNILEGCIRNEIGTLYLASSSEVYQLPPRIPTDEQVPLVVPDVKNPRFSYGGGKIICELLAVNYGRKLLDRVCIYRPHNIYGPDMGWEHVVPQFAVRLHRLAAAQLAGILRFPIQGSGAETRSFSFIDDFIDGVSLVQEKGEHLGIYHIGTTDEVSMADVARLVAKGAGRDVEIVPGNLLAGSVSRRCPDIGKLRAIGYAPKIPLSAGVARTVGWYFDNMALAPAA
jgi:nucleoside-diphosphate-sugar epimerase